MAATEMNHDTAHEDKVDFDVPARNGWSFFSKFLLINVVAIAATLVLIAFLTVWR